MRGPRPAVAGTGAFWPGAADGSTWRGQPGCREPPGGRIMSARTRPEVLSMLMRDILVAVDGSPDSDAAVDAAATLCRKGEGTIHLLHVVPLGRAVAGAFAGLPAA